MRNRLTTTLILSAVGLDASECGSIPPPVDVELFASQHEEEQE